MGKDTYSHIHWDSQQRRTVSVREAARLQSFPDGFRFAGTMNSAFRQIGNAVPPLLAWAVAKRLKEQLTTPTSRQTQMRQLAIIDSHDLIPVMA
jgi:DNA (cytosine-5)-methyltransferase 1